MPQDAAREIFLAKQSPGPNGVRKERWVLGNFLFFRMHRIVDIYFVGGFGTVQVRNCSTRACWVIKTAPAVDTFVWFW